MGATFLHPVVYAFSFGCRQRHSFLVALSSQEAELRLAVAVDACGEHRIACPALGTFPPGALLYICISNAAPVTRFHNIGLFVWGEDMQIQCTVNPAIS